MKVRLEEAAKVLVCRSCGNNSLTLNLGFISCPKCLVRYRYLNEKVFIDEPQVVEVETFPNSLKGRTVDKNILRAESRKYLKKVLSALEFELVLDVGTGRGHFLSEFELDKKVLTLDHMAYEDVIVVANIEKGLPISENSFDVVILSHTLEHIFDTEALLSDCFRILKPGGFLVGVVPFLTKVHQAPYDFHRLTDFALRRYFKDIGFTCIEVLPLTSIVETISLHINSSYKFLSKELNVFERGVIKLLIKSWQLISQNLKRGEVRSDFTLGYGFNCKKL